MFLLVKKAFRASKKIFLVLFVFSLVISLYSVFATKPPTNEITAAEYNKTKVDNFIKNTDFNDTKSGKAMISVYRVTTCTFIGEGCDESDKDAQDKSILGSLSNWMAFPMANPPASGIAWVSDGLQHAGFIPETYAAEGIGFAVIKPLSTVWKIFRDIAYLCIVLVLIAVSFMIMFRVQIDSQTAVAVQNSLPKIVVSLLLITFSFAIAGFLIDLMYLTIAISISMIGSGSENLRVLQNDFIAAKPNMILDAAIPINVWTGESSSFWTTLIPALGGGLAVVNTFTVIGNVSGSLLAVLPQIIKTFLYGVGGLATVVLVEMIMEKLGRTTNIIEGIGALTFDIGGLGKGVLDTALIILFLVVIGSIAVPLVLIIAMLTTIFWLFFRVFVLLLTTYIKILLLIVFGPLFMLVEAIPGQNAFSTWFKSLFAEIFSFPVVIILFMVANRIVNTMLAINMANLERSQIGVNPALGTGLPPNATPTEFWTPPFLYGLNLDALAFLVGMGIIFLIPDLVVLYKKMMGVEELPIKAGPGIFFAGGTVAVGTAFNLLTQFSSAKGALLGDNRQGIWENIRALAGGRSPFNLKNPGAQQSNGGNP